MHDHNDAAVRLLPPDLKFLLRWIAHRPWSNQESRRAKPARLNLPRTNPHYIDQIILHGVGTSLTKIDVVIRRGSKTALS
jgi:hypothetical protein